MNHEGLLKIKYTTGYAVPAVTDLLSEAPGTLIRRYMIVMKECQSLAHQKWECKYHLVV